MTHLDEQGAMQTRETMISDLSALPSSPVSELVLRLRSEAAQFSGRDFKSIFDTCTEAAHALSTRNAELEREVKRLREALEAVDGLIPTDVITSILSIGRVEWGATEEKSSEDHLIDLDDTLRMTREYFDLEDVPVAMHGVYIEGSEVVVCHTGTSPNSPQHARILTGAWNRLHELALALSTSPQGGEHE